MSMLRKEWTREEQDRLNRDLTVAKMKVFVAWGFKTDEISKIMNLPESMVRAMVNS